MYKIDNQQLVNEIYERNATRSSTSEKLKWYRRATSVHGVWQITTVPIPETNHNKTVMDRHLNGKF